MFKHTLAVALLIVCGMSYSGAQEILTLEKALNIAFEHSPSLIQSKLSLEQRQLNLKAQNASLKSQFSLDVNPFNYTRNNQYDSYNSKWFANENMTSSASFGIQQPIKCKTLPIGRQGVKIRLTTTIFHYGLNSLYSPTIKQRWN